MLKIIVNTDNIDGSQLFNRLSFTEQVEEEIRVQIEHKKLLMKEYTESGDKKDEIDKITNDIAKLQDMLSKLDEKNRQSAIGDIQTRDR
jgi:hypothetical protein